MRSLRRCLPLLLLVPFAAMLFPAFYNRMAPTLAGFPFFYTWQFAWIIIAAALTFIVHRGSRA